MPRDPPPPAHAAHNLRVRAANPGLFRPKSATHTVLPSASTHTSTIVPLSSAVTSATHLTVMHSTTVSASYTTAQGDSRSRNAVTGTGLNRALLVTVCVLGMLCLLGLAVIVWFTLR